MRHVSTASALFAGGADPPTSAYVDTKCFASAMAYSSALHFWLHCLAT